MTKENRDAASRASFDGAQFNAPTIIQIGDGSTANQGVNAATPATIEGILKFLKQYWLYETGIGLSSCLTYVATLLPDWVILTLLWITSTATTCFVIRERRTRRQAKERGAQVAEERRQVIDGLSDAAVELIVAALAKRGPIYRQEERIVFSAGTVKVEVNKPFICSLTPEKTPTADVLLDELVKAGLLQKRSDDGYEVASHAREQADYLRERDFFRIRGALPGPAKRLLDLIENRDEVLGFEVFGSESTTFLANEKMGKFSHPLFRYPVDEIKRTILALQALRFVETWELRKTVGEFNQVPKLTSLLASFTQESIDVFWQSKGCLAGERFDCLIGRLTDEGWEFVKKMQG